MDYPINLEGFEGQAIVVQPAGFLSGPKLLVNGQPAAKGQKRGQMVLRRNDGSEALATWKPQFIDVPRLIVDGQTINVAEPLKWYVWLWSGLPFILVVVGGAIGAVVGMIGFGVNANIFRSSWPTAAKFAVSAIVSVVAVVAYIVLAALLLAAVG
ncbi:MAG: hypothetical protein HGA45_30410 [Chloroflexales bacterium]|nr:hypothetical protein [Chloroflexales bacterium]